MDTARTAFWVLSLGIIAGYLFFLVLGGFSVDDTVALSILVTVLAILWIARLALLARRATDTRDPGLIRARERRGF